MGHIDKYIGIGGVDFMRLHLLIGEDPPQHLLSHGAIQVEGQMQRRFQFGPLNEIQAIANVQLPEHL